MKRFVARSLCLLVLGCSACTTTLFDNGDPSFGYGVSILSERDGFSQVGDDFSLGTNAVLRRVEWWGEGEGENFSVRIFEVAAGIPNSVPLHDINLGTVAGTPQLFFGTEHLFYSAPLPSISLDAGDYLISIVDQTATEPWYWSVSCEDGCEDDSFRRPNDGDPWMIGNFEMAFRLRGAFEQSLK